jgi:hypothetical protein
VHGRGAFAGDAAVGFNFHAHGGGEVFGGSSPGMCLTSPVAVMTTGFCISLFGKVSMGAKREVESKNKSSDGM